MTSFLAVAQRIRNGTSLSPDGEVRFLTAPPSSSYEILDLAQEQVGADSERCREGGSRGISGLEEGLSGEFSRLLYCFPWAPDMVLEKILTWNH